MLYHLDVIRNYYWLHAIAIIIVIVVVVIIVVVIVCISIKVKRTEVKQFVWIKYICFNKVHNYSILALYKGDKQKNKTKQDKSKSTTYVPGETFRVDFCKVGSSMYEVRCCFRVWCWWEEEEGGRIEPSIDVAAAPRRPGYVEFVLDVDELLLLFDHENIVSIKTVR